MSVIDTPSHPPIVFTVPVELTHRILAFCHPLDVAAFSRTCRLAYHLVGDEYLWRQLWHAYSFDNPIAISQQRQLVNLSTDTPCPIHWRDEFTRRLKAELIAIKKPARSSLKEKKDAMQTFLLLMKEASPPSADQLGQEPVSANLQWAESILRNSRLIAPSSVVVDTTPDINYLQAQLRSYMGDSFDWVKSDQLMAKRRNRSRSFVYNLRNYNGGNDHGPFRPNGHVNWVHIEHLINVILSNLRDLSSHRALPRPPSNLESIRPYTAPGAHSLGDWAGVEGTWRRYVCFMDYRDLFAFNVLPNQYSPEVL